MRELIEYDITEKKFKFESATVYFKIPGGYALREINQEEIIKYILMNTGEVDEYIPINYKDEYSDYNFNREFHNAISNIRKRYKDKAEKELERKFNLKSLKITFKIV